MKTTTFLFSIIPIVILLLSYNCCCIIGKAIDDDNYDDDDDRPLQCSLTDAELVEVDPALEYMEYDVGNGIIEKTLVYVEPTIDSIYNGYPPSVPKVPMKFKGFSGKFINMSNRYVTLYWEVPKKKGQKVAVTNLNPFTAFGITTFPNHKFMLTLQDDPTMTILVSFTIGEYPLNLYIYNPYIVPNDEILTQKNIDTYLLLQNDRIRYDILQKTIKFNEYYSKYTGRAYLVNYLRKRPIHFMWRAQYIQQQHYVETYETHYIEQPPIHLLQSINTKKQSYTNNNKNKDTSRILLHEYRKPGRLNMTLEVLSVLPRVFQINNFLSTVEIDHILELANNSSLQSSKSAGDNVNSADKSNDNNKRTRTSTNSWISREQSPIIDSIYRRAADLMRIDEALLRNRNIDEYDYPDLINRNTLAEDLQLVHYNVTEEYKAHHDFSYTRLHEEGSKIQPARFATLLLYLNDDMDGGETIFPRWVNAETFRELVIKPKVGNAILFYSQLPDGNFDDFSHHASKPVNYGEKWLINLWVWDPVYK